MKKQAEIAVELATVMGLCLYGHPPEIQSAALADCLATWLVGHFDKDGAGATAKMREELLSKHLRLVRLLIPVNEEKLLEQIRETSN